MENLWLPKVHCRPSTLRYFAMRHCVFWQNPCTYAHYLTHSILIVMKKLFIPALFSILFAFGCSKSDDNDTAKIPFWVVSSYQSGTVGANSTNPFDGYTFEFNDPNELVIHRPNGNTETAKWAVDTDNAVAAFTMDNASAPIDLLMGVWQVTAQTATELKLERQDTPSTVFEEGAAIEFKQQ